MKTFFRTVFASMVGCLFSFIVIFIIMIFVISGIISSAKKDTKIKPEENSVLSITLDHPIYERSSQNPLKDIDFMSLKPSKRLGLNEIIKAIENAAEDKNIKGILLEPTIIDAGFPTIEEIRTALEKFKESGKFIYAYSEMYSQKAYYLATVADSIFINPQGMLDFRGLAAHLAFFKGTFDKFDIEAQIIRHGVFKSAAEPFMLDKMSDENRVQYLSFLGFVWNDILSKISESRGITAETLNKYADTVAVRNPNDAVKLKFVDQSIYKDELLGKIKLATKSSKDINKLPSVSLHKYAKSQETKTTSKAKDRIAVVYAVGKIYSGEGDDEQIGSERVSKALRDARLDDRIKSVVFRINSPGGSVVASEVIWREVKLLTEKKPVIVSMGDVAASGGYYIAAPATKILAQPNTITGSIGVIGVLFNLGDFFKNNFGVTFDVAKTNKHADMLTFTRALTPFEHKIIQEWVEEIYDSFITKVADGRGMTKEQVDSIGQGRIWSGKEAVKLGLVDQLGGINDAIALAAKLAEIEDYRIVELPEQKYFIEVLFENFADDQLSSFFKNYLTKKYPYLKTIENIDTKEPFLTRMPFDIVVE